MAPGLVETPICGLQLTFLPMSVGCRGELIRHCLSQGSGYDAIGRQEPYRSLDDHEPPASVASRSFMAPRLRDCRD